MENFAINPFKCTLGFIWVNMPTKFVPEKFYCLSCQVKELLQRLHLANTSMCPLTWTYICLKKRQRVTTSLCLWGLFHSSCMSQKTSPVLQSFRSPDQFPDGLEYCAKNQVNPSMDSNLRDEHMDKLSSRRGGVLQSVKWNSFFSRK